MLRGGVPRHCGHYPFGVMEFKRLMKGPQYASTLVKKAEAAGVNIFINTTVTALHEGGKLSLTTPDGTTQLQAQRVVLSTGNSRKQPPRSTLHRRTKTDGRNVDRSIAITGLFAKQKTISAPDHIGHRTRLIFRHHDLSPYGDETRCNG